MPRADRAAVVVAVSGLAGLAVLYALAAYGQARVDRELDDAELRWLVLGEG